MRTPWYAIYSLGSWRAPWSARRAATRASPLTPSGIWVYRCLHHPAASWRPAWICLYARRCSMVMRCPHAPNARHDENAPRVLPYSVSPNIWWYVSRHYPLLPNINITYIFIALADLKRFSETRWSKLSNIVEFPTGDRELNMASYGANANSNVHYSLYAISNHMGT